MCLSYAISVNCIISMVVAENMVVLGSQNGKSLPYGSQKDVRYHMVVAGSDNYHMVVRKTFATIW